ncbi:MAG: nitronate monooxygenase [Rhodopila sp.]
MSAFAALRERLRLPLIAAPMFGVSGVELVVAACRHGVIGAFPTANCRSVEELDAWLSAFRAEGLVAPWCANLIVHRSNPRLRDDLAVLLRYLPEIVITSVGSPAEVVGPLHDAGALVLADGASIRHAERAVAAGADGLVLLTAGAGGQTGLLNPFAFVRAVRRWFERAGLAMGRRWRRQWLWDATLVIWGRASLRRRRAWLSRAISGWWWRVVRMTFC